jgi:outer membrane protein OmpA-like peptidoglycan-associated protein
MTDEIGRLNEELAKKPKEVEVIKYVDRTVNNYNAPVTNTVASVNATDVYVFFAFDSAELDARAKEELDKLGQNGVYDIVAFASNEGGTEYNIALSQRRADAVKAYLEGRGCKINSAVGKGVAFGITTGRVAVVTSK